MNLPFEQLNPEANPAGTLQAYTWLKQFYAEYPTGAELAEALYQYRRENNMIVEREEKKRRVKQLQAEIDSEQTD